MFCDCHYEGVQFLWKEKSLGKCSFLVESYEWRDGHKEWWAMLAEKCEELDHGFVEVRPKLSFWRKVGFWQEGIKTSRDHNPHLVFQACSDQSFLDICGCSNDKGKELLTIMLEEWLISNSNIPVENLVSNKTNISYGLNNKTHTYSYWGNIRNANWLI